MKLEQAQVIAQEVRSHLFRWCERIEVAGSIRRKKPDVGDIELVAIPRSVAAVDLFGEDAVPVRSSGFVSSVRGLGFILKGDPSRGRYVQIALPFGIKLDLFTATADNWGLIYAIRTGSAEYSHRVLASGWVRAGYHSMDGMLCSKFHTVPVREEPDLFKLIGIPWTEPELRECPSPKEGSFR